ncbi:PTS sugar transporter subunit IIA [Enterococcus faecalis]|nr:MULTISPECIES: PTS sugar transporter subunit IIA [Enterococcus]MDH5030618.1 PTS sugar transporter subunit IIA [Enterococcus faecalis]MDH5049464.1 PTS sugar transporter subunit IIA [Enterococcus faecalis]MDI7017164.1 PTS sugar transporter subunit IIA [Enterococcus faecalis]
MMLLYNYDNYLSVNHFLDTLKVSKTTFMNDLKKAETQIIPDGIRIAYNRKDGYHLEGNEADIRYHLMRTVIEDFADSENIFFYQYFVFNEKIEKLEPLEEKVKELLEQFHVSLVGNRFQEFSYTLILIAPRLDADWPDFFDHFNFQTLFKMPEYFFAEALLEYLGIKNQHAILYVCGWTLGLSIGDYLKKTPDFSIINELIHRIISRFEHLAGIRFSNPEQAVDQLYAHFRPAYYRIFFRLPIVNVMHQKIKNEYYDLYSIVNETMKPIGNLFDYSIPEEEISFLTLHFASLMDDFDEYAINRKIGMVVCPNGVGSSAIIYNELKSVFPELLLLGPVDVASLRESQQDFDLIFTTVASVELYLYNKPVFVVDPIMTVEEKYNLVRDVYGGTRSGGTTEYDVETILGIVEKYATINDRVMLKNELKSLCSSLSEIPEEIEEQNSTPVTKSDRISLMNMVQPSFIQTDLVARNWEDAFYMEAKPLVDAGNISRRYIEKIIQTTHKEGAYMIVTDNVALPHARPEDGVNKLGMGITSLRYPIQIFDKRVKYIFTLAAVDQNRHLKAISEFVDLIEDGRIFDVLDHQRPQEVYTWLEERLKESRMK